MLVIMIAGHYTKYCSSSSNSSSSISSSSSKKGKGFPYSLPSVGPGADPGVQAASPHETISHPPGCRLPLNSARPAVTFPAA